MSKKRELPSKNGVIIAITCFVLLNTILFMFAILYLGIHWFIDIPLGMLIGGVGALFIHHLQPRIRNDYGSFFKGFSAKKIRQHLLIEGVVTLLLFTTILMAVQVQENSVDERVSFQLGPNESLYEIIQPHQEDIYVESNVTNLDETITIEVVVLGIEIAQPSMNNGSIDWNIVRSLGAVYTISPMSTLQLEIYSPDDYSYILIHNPSENSSGDVVQVRIINDYHEDVMVQALALSICSMWMTGFVINRLRRLYKYNRKFYDSTPSHLWGRRMNRLMSVSYEAPPLALNNG